MKIQFWIFAIKSMATVFVAQVLGELPTTGVPTLMTGRVTTIQGPKGSNNNNNNPNTTLYRQRSAKNDDI